LSGPTRRKRKIGGQEMAIKMNVFLIAAFLLFAVDAAAISGSEWRHLSPAAQQYYIIGILDGWDNLGTITLLLAEQRSPVGIGFTKEIGCTIEMEYAQINFIIQKYMENHPSQWHNSMPLLVWPALAEVCAPANK
jgi:hypothetical protein